MLNSSPGKKHRPNTLMSEYSSLLGDAILRHRTRIAEHSARIESELANRVKSEFIANMSHELRTPLNTILGFSKLLSEHDRRKLPDDEIVQYAALIHDSSTHLLTVINDILDISKLQSGRFTLNSTEVMIDEVLDAAVHQIMTQATDAGLTLETEYGRDLPPIRGDVAKLGQIFTNLLSNAIKFTEAGGRVNLSAGRLGDGSVTIFIRDTGLGITPDELKFALQPFGQVEGSRTRWREGTGLGLPIAREIVNAHRGNIFIDTPPEGSGTLIRVRLPLNA